MAKTGTLEWPSLKRYDLESSAPEALANISTRGLVQTGENVMIGGFYVGGNEPAIVLIRAIGPSLTEQGVAGALDDPELQLADANGSTITNDDWATVAADIPNGFAPKDSRESALVATLAPGAYTAIVSGKAATTGRHNRRGTDRGLQLAETGKISGKNRIITL